MTAPDQPLGLSGPARLLRRTILAAPAPMTPAELSEAARVPLAFVGPALDELESAAAVHRCAEVGGRVRGVSIQDCQRCGEPVVEG